MLSICTMYTLHHDPLSKQACRVRIRTSFVEQELALPVEYYYRSDSYKETLVTKRLAMSGMNFVVNSESSTSHLVDVLLHVIVV